MRHVREHEQWFRDHGATTYAQPDIAGLWMGHVSPPNEDVARFQNEVSAESGFLRLYTSLQVAQQFCSVARASGGADVGGRGDFLSDALRLVETWAPLARRNKLVYTPRIPFPETLTIAFTGHRIDKLGGYETDEAERNEARIKDVIRAALYFLRPPRIISGMALGVDQWAAEVALELNIPFTAAVPFPEQESRWPAPARRHYLELLRRADKQVAVEPTFTKAAFQRRNAWMVDNCTLLIAVWDGSAGGTANCVRYAQNVLRPTLYLNPQALSRRLY